MAKILDVLLTISAVLGAMLIMYSVFELALKTAEVFNIKNYYIFVVVLLIFGFLVWSVISWTSNTAYQACKESITQEYEEKIYELNASIEDSKNEAYYAGYDVGYSLGYEIGYYDGSLSDE